MVPVERRGSYEELVAENAQLRAAVVELQAEVAELQRLRGLRRGLGRRTRGGHVPLRRGSSCGTHGAPKNPL